MSTSAVRSDSPRLAPEPRFWQRYSPHHEASLSGAGSLGLHVLVVGLLTLTAYLGWLQFAPRHKVMPWSVGTFAGDGGPAGGVPDGDNRLPGEATAPHQPAAEHGSPVPDPRPNLPAIAGVQAPKVVLPELSRPLQAGDVSGMMADLRKIQERPVAANPKSGVGLAGKDLGKGGPGGPGPGGGRIDQRTRRMDRWIMHFDTRDGGDYLRQLQGLGAILAIPTKDDYKIVRDLSKRPALLLDEDVRAIDRISWSDRDPRSVGQLMQALGLDLRPDHFYAFMPAELEQKLLRLELAFAGRQEEQIDRTHFRVVRTGARFDVIVAEQNPLKLP